MSAETTSCGWDLGPARAGACLQPSLFSEFSVGVRMTGELLADL
jgi:hypothetical protein